MWSILTSVSTWKNLADDDDDDDVEEDQYISNTAIQQYNKNNILRKRIKVSVGKGTFFEDALEVDARVGEQVAVPQEVEHRLEVVQILMMTMMMMKNSGEEGEE